jgi:hypothetical protein
LIAANCFCFLVDCVDIERKEKITDSYFVSCAISGFLKQRADFIVRLQHWLASIRVRQVKDFGPGEKILNIERRDSDHYARAQSIPPRVGQAAFQVEPGNLHLAANSRNQHEQPRICIIKVEEQHNAPVCLGVAMHESLFS